MKDIIHSNYWNQPLSQNVVKPLEIYLYSHIRHIVVQHYLLEKHCSSACVVFGGAQREFRIIRVQFYNWLETTCRCNAVEHHSSFSVFLRLPALDDSGRGHHHPPISLPVAARLCSHPASLPPSFPRCTCSLPDGPAVQRGHWPLQTWTSSGGTTSAWVALMHRPATTLKPAV